MKNIDGKKLLLQNVNVVDGVADYAAPNQDIYIEEGVIREVIPAGSRSFAEDVVKKDYAGCTVMPGLIDSHVHLCMEPVGDPVAGMLPKSQAALTLTGMNNMKELLANGITYVRGMGDPFGIDIDLAKASKDGIIEGPGVVPAGRLICMTGGHGWQFGVEADGVDAVRKAVRTEIKLGAGHIKMMATGGVMTPNVKSTSTQLTYEELRTGVEEAHHAGKKTATHAQGANGIRNAVMAGIDSVEHGFYLTEEIIEMMLQKGTFYVPTLSAPHFILEQRDLVPDFVVEKTKIAKEAHLNSFRMAVEAGVAIAMGTDAGTPFNVFGSARKEMQLMWEAGMKPEAVIKSATAKAAELLGIEEHYGTIEAGKAADLIVLKEDPIQNIGTLQDELIVYKNGREV